MQFQLLSDRWAVARSFRNAGRVKRELQLNEEESGDFLSTALPLLGLVALALIALVGAAIVAAVEAFRALSGS